MCVINCYAHIGRRIIFEINKFKFTLKLNNLINSRYLKQPTTVHCYNLKNFTVNEMSPKRVRTPKKVAIVADDDDDDVPIEEKKPVKKRERKPPTKVQLIDEKNEKINDEDDDSEDSEEDSETESKPVKKKKSSGRKPKSEAIEKVESAVGKSNRKDTEPPPAKKAKVEKKMLNPIDTDLESIGFNCSKRNKKGQKHNLKFCSWNVSGIRALIKKNGMDYMKKENADFIALQETKCDMTKLPDEVKIPGYKHYYIDSDKSGYCGVALYCKEDNEPIEITYGINIPEFDKDGRVITAEYDNFYLVNVYVPNAGPKLVKLSKRLKWNDKFMAYVKNLDSKKPVIICGDMNVAHQEIDLTNPKTNKKNAGFSKEEREGMTELLENGFVDTFRDLYPEKTGAYTFWSYFANARSKNIGWRLDYYIVSEGIKDTICDNVIRSSVLGSDHCPIVLYINL